MRTLTLLTLASITTSTLTHLFMEENALNGQNQSVKLNSSDTPLTDQELQKGLDKFISMLQRYQQINQAQHRQTRSQEERLHAQLVAVETRLRSLETGQNNALMIKEVSEVALVDHDQSGAPIQEVAEWMDDSLQWGNFDHESTEQAKNEALRTLSGLSGVSLEQIQCGDRFCRAELKYDQGRKDSVMELFGKPPFTNNGFTTEESDGRTALYFVRPGESLEELRREVLQESLH